MDGLRQLEEEWGQTKSHPMFKRPGHFTIYPGLVQGGPNGPFVISEESRVEYAIWHPPQDPVEDVKAEIEAHIARVAATDSWLRENPPKVEWLLWWPPFDVSPDEPICKALEAAYTGVFGTDAPYYGFAAVDDGAFLNRAGIPAITIGPGSLLVAHGPDEHVEIDDLIDAAKGLCAGHHRMVRGGRLGETHSHPVQAVGATHASPLRVGEQASQPPDSRVGRPLRKERGRFANRPYSWVCGLTARWIPTPAFAVTCFAGMTGGCGKVPRR
jgi:hypothetical protein